MKKFDQKRPSSGEGVDFVDLKVNRNKDIVNVKLGTGPYHFFNVIHNFAHDGYRSLGITLNSSCSAVLRYYSSLSRCYPPTFGLAM